MRWVPAVRRLGCHPPQGICCNTWGTGSSFLLGCRLSKYTERSPAAPLRGWCTRIHGGGCAVKVRRSPGNTRVRLRVTEKVIYLHRADVALLHIKRTLKPIIRSHDVLPSHGVGQGSCSSGMSGRMAGIIQTICDRDVYRKHRAEED